MEWIQTIIRSSERGFRGEPKMVSSVSKMEILAPAGGLDTIEPAVRTGADAVYLGMNRLSARASAKNFDRDELVKATEYCHARGVKVYLACNTLVRDEELKEAMELIEYACSVPVDALIMQDIGLISMVRQTAPEMRIHASTQMSVHTPKGAELLYRNGIKRVVLSRELSREEIIEIHKACPIELEVFVHGALCMCVSGQCYFSAMLGGRSGNRGACAQPCRLPFSAGGGVGYDLSLKDNSLLPYLKELEALGVESAKIEGRMKRPEYVAAAVAACRQSLDKGYVEPELLKMSEAVFSRSGFTDGYYTGKLGADMFGVRSKENVLSATNKVYGAIHTMYKDERQSVPLCAELTVKKDSAVTLSVSDREGHCATAEGAAPQQALKAALNAEKCASYIRKTGGTPFYIEDYRAEVEDGLSLSGAELNSVRRKALEDLLSQRTKRLPVSFTQTPLPTVGTRSQKQPKYYRARFTSDDIPDDFLECELIYVPLSLSNEKLEKLMDRGFAVAAEIPRGMFGLERKIFDDLKRVQALGINEVLASNIGAVAMAKELGMDIHGGFGLNITNTASLCAAEQAGLMDVEVSFELTLDQISKLGGRIPIGIVAGGYLPLMLCRNYPGGKRPEKGKQFLIDRKGLSFPLKSSGNCTEVLNSVPLELADRKREILGADFLTFRFSVENSVESGETFRLFNSGIGRKGAITRGLYYRGVE